MIAHQSQPPAMDALEQRYQDAIAARIAASECLYEAETLYKRAVSEVYRVERLRSRARTAWANPR